MLWNFLWVVFVFQSDHFDIQIVFFAPQIFKCYYFRLFFGKRRTNQNDLKIIIRERQTKSALDSCARLHRTIAESLPSPGRSSPLLWFRSVSGPTQPFFFLIFGSTDCLHFIITLASAYTHPSLVLVHLFAATTHQCRLGQKAGWRWIFAAVQKHREPIGKVARPKWSKL